MAAYPDNEPILAYAPGSVERRELQEEMDRQMNKMHDWWCKESEDRMSTELCSTWYEQLATHKEGEKRKPPKVRPPIEQVEEMHDAFCAQEGNAELEPCMMWSKRPPKSKEL